MISTFTDQNWTSTRIVSNVYKSPLEKGDFSGIEKLEYSYQMIQSLCPPCLRAMSLKACYTEIATKAGLWSVGIDFNLKYQH